MYLYFIMPKTYIILLYSVHKCMLPSLQSENLNLNCQIIFNTQQLLLLLRWEILENINYSCFD